MEQKQRNFHFESNVLLVACLLGFIRSAIALIDDLNDIQIHDDFLSDLSFGLLFLFMGAAILFKRASTPFLVFFYIAFVTLLIRSFLDASGLQKSIEHNIFAGLILIFLTLKDRLPLYFSALLITGVIGSFMYFEYQFAFSINYVDQHYSSINFLFASLGTIGFTYYAKTVFEKKRAELRENAESLNRKSIELTKKNDLLVQQKEALEQLTWELDQKVIARTAALKSQVNRREKYLTITFNELTEKYENTIAIIEKMRSKELESEFMTMLHQSAERLTTELNELKRKVNADN